MPMWAAIIVSIVGSGAAFGFIQFLVARHDAKKDKKAEILEAIR